MKFLSNDDEDERSAIAQLFDREELDERGTPLAHAGSRRCTADEDVDSVDAPKVSDSIDNADADSSRARRALGGTTLVTEILSRAKEPWASLSLGGEELVRVRLGQILAVMGPTGAGKSSLVGGLLVEHAREHGPAVYMSRELPADEIAARVIGMQCDASWFDVLTGRVTHDEMASRLPERLRFLERRSATLDRLDEEITALRRARGSTDRCRDRLRADRRLGRERYAVARHIRHAADR